MKKPAPGKKTPRVQAFLAAIREMPSVSRAAKAAKIQRGLHYRRLKVDAAYRAAFEAAWAEGVQSLEDEAVRRAQLGVTKPKFYQGEVCGHVQEYSDSLMMFLLRGARPEKYREIQEHRGPGGGPIESKLEIVFVKPPA